MESALVTEALPLGAGAAGSVTGPAKPPKQERLPPRKRRAQKPDGTERPPDLHRLSNATVIDTREPRLKPLPPNADQQIPLPGGPTCMCVCSHHIALASTHTYRARPLVWHGRVWTEENGWTCRQAREPTVQAAQWQPARRRSSERDRPPPLTDPTSLEPRRRAGGRTKHFVH